MPCLLAYRAKRRRGAACQKGQPGTAASCKRRAPRRLPEPLRPRLRLPVGYKCAKNSTAREVLAGSTPALCGSIWRWAGDKFPREDSSERSRALPPSLGDLLFPARRAPPAAAGAGPLVISAQNDLAPGSHRPKRRWEAATHRKRVPAQRKAAAERQPSATADS